MNVWIEKHISKINVVWMIICIMISAFGFHFGNLILAIPFAFYALWALANLIKYGWLD